MHLIDSRLHDIHARRTFRDFRVQVCEATAAYRYRQDMNNWCQVNCIRIPSNCPPGICHCLWVLKLIDIRERINDHWFEIILNNQIASYRVIIQCICVRSIFFNPRLLRDICIRSDTCDAIGDIAEKPGADQYCLRRCMRYPSNCPTDRCNCYWSCERDIDISYVALRCESQRVLRRIEINKKPNLHLRLRHNFAKKFYSIKKFFLPFRERFFFCKAEKNCFYESMI